MRGPLLFLLPPRTTFGGEDYTPALALMDLLRRHRIHVRPVEMPPPTSAEFAAVPAWWVRYVARLSPRAVTSSHAVAIWMANVECAGRPVNVFTRVLGVPAFAFWDDPLCQAFRCLGGGCRSPADSTGGVLQSVRGVLGDPQMHNFAWDPGQVRVLRELGTLDENVVVAPFVVDHFIEAARRCPRRRNEYRFDVCTAGNIFKSESPAWDTGVTARFIAAVADRKLADLGRPLWDAFNDELGSLQAEGAQWAHALDTDQTYFWNLYTETTHRVTAHVRIHLLANTRATVDFVGGLQFPAGIDVLKARTRVRHHPHVDRFRRLSEVFRRSKINLVMSNSLAQTGIPPKLLEIIASGGFFVTDPREETERLLGPEVREVTYRSAEDLDRLISFFLSKPARREELRDLFHRRVRDHFSDGPFGRLAERLRREHLPPCPKTPAIPDESLRTSAAAIGWRLRWKLKDLQWLLKRC